MRLRFVIVLFVVLFCHGKCKDEDIIPEIRYLNPNVDPCDDFYEFSCGNFKNYHPRSDRETLINHFTILQKDLLELSNRILSLPDEKHDPVALKKARAIYSSCVDTSFSNSDDMRGPEITVLNQVGDFPLVTVPHWHRVPQFSWSQLGDIIADFGVPLVFNFRVYPHTLDATKYFLILENEQLLYPTMVIPETEDSYDLFLEQSLSKYVKMTKRGRNLLPFDIFLRHIVFKLRDIVKNKIQNDTIVLKNLDETTTFMRALVNGGLIENGTEIEEIEGTSITVGDLQRWTNKHFGEHSKLDWTDFLNRVLRLSGVKISNATEIAITQDIHLILYGTINLIRQTPGDILKNFALIRIFLFMAIDSDQSTIKAFEDYFRANNKEVFERWEYCTRKVMDLATTTGLSLALTHEYQKHYFNSNKLEQATEMLQNIIATFEEIIAQSDWMDEDSKKGALQKVSNMITTLGYPEFIENKKKLDKFYANLRVCKWDNYGNSKRLRAFRQAYSFSLLDKSRDRASWDKSPLDVNAYYNRPNNKITLPVSVLNPVFFSGNNSFLDYGRLGMILAHEITHGFDSTGHYYNDDGLLQDWWTNETLEAFQERLDCFKNQYSQYYIPELDTYVNGSTSIDENLADNGGARETYRAFKKLNMTIPRIANFTEDQTFFIGLGTMWCANESNDYIANAAIKYAPTRWRVNGPLSNLKEFAEAFSCPIGSTLNPKNRCLLW